MKTLKDRSAAVDRTAEAAAVTATVSRILADIEAGGDGAVRKYSEELDSWSPESFLLSAEEIERIVATVPQQVIADIEFAQAQVRGFAERQLASVQDFEVETMPGVHLGQRHLPVASVGA